MTQPPFARKPSGICFGLEGIIRLTSRVGVTEDDPWGTISGETEIHNEILTSGLDHLASDTSGIFAVCKIGTGTTPVDVAQTGLVAQAATTGTGAPGGDTFSAMTATSPRYNRMVFRRRFAAGVLNGTYTEIGFGPASGSLFNRALIVPTKTVLATETLDVEYELRTYIPSADATGTATIGAASYGFTVRPLHINNTTAGFGNATWGITGTPLTGTWQDTYAYSGGALAAQTASQPTFTEQAYGSAVRSLPDAYVPGTGFRKVRHAFDLDDLNVAGGSFTHLRLLAGVGTWQIEFSPPVPKTAAKTMTLDIGFTFARYP